MNVTFDTLKLARTLHSEAEFTQKQAEGIAAALAEVMREGIPTRADLQAVKDELSHKIDAVDEKLTHKIEAVSADLRATEERLTHKIDAVDEKLTHRIDTVEEKLTHKIASVEERLAGRIDTGHEKLARQIEASKSETIKWVVGIIGFQIVAVIGATVILARILHG